MSNALDIAVRLVTVADAGRMMSISRSCAYRLVAEGDLQVVDIASTRSKRPKLRVDVRAIDELVSRRTLP